MKEYLNDMIEDLKGLIAIKSVKDEPVANAPYGEGTLKALEYMLDLGKKYGMKAVNVDGRAGYLEYGEGKHMIGVLLHLDVVPEQDGWISDPYVLTERDGYLYGRGTSDDKGPAIAVFYSLVDLIKKNEIKGYRVRLIFGLDEECGSSCMAHYVKTQELPTMGFVPDADFPVIYAEKGILTVVIEGEGSESILLKAGDRPNVVPGKCTVEYKGKTIVYEGKPAHGAAPFSGINAIKIAAQNSMVINGHPMIEFFKDCLADKHYGEGLDINLSDESGRLTVNPGIMSIDNEKSYCILNIRYPVTVDHMHISEKIQTICVKYGLKVKQITDNPALYVDKKSILVSTLLSVYRSMTKDYRQPLAIGGGTYARTMPNLVAFGMNMPDDVENAHQANECIKKQRLYEGAAIYRESIKRLGETLISRK
ncbi:MAG TPA: Sapep family Mn(2+)-dependent dipeptidase [Clostridia bacterium]|nr:MAG: putative dipeptidase [Firmicutes bacterium ADurb.Bin146]HOD93340.1 Sapep family Mn(2+)-dependent dipeptidase [Clostridia bacterium]HQM39596.1 Sapep family Mn(2+)-dependent dipeptidase [Clostridia bacterium]